MYIREKKIKGATLDPKQKNSYDRLKEIIEILFSSEQFKDKVSAELIVNRNTLRTNDDDPISHAQIVIYSFDSAIISHLLSIIMIKVSGTNITARFDTTNKMSFYAPTWTNVIEL